MPYIHSSPFFNSRKAFDHVNHSTLFNKLLRKGGNAAVVKLLISQYEAQKFHVRWGTSLSDGFSVTNGMRQGGILSPYLFNVYIDELSDRLGMSGIVCRYLGSIHPRRAGGVWTPHPLPRQVFADISKTVALAPFPHIFSTHVVKISDPGHSMSGHQVRSSDLVSEKV